MVLYITMVTTGKVSYYVSPSLKTCLPHSLWIRISIIFIYCPNQIVKLDSGCRWGSIPMLSRWGQKLHLPSGLYVQGHLLRLAARGSSAHSVVYSFSSFHDIAQVWSRLCLRATWCTGPAALSPNCRRTVFHTLESLAELLFFSCDQSRASNSAVFRTQRT